MITYPGQLIIHSVQRIMNMCECQATTPAWWLYHITHLMRWDKLLILRAEGSNSFFLKLLKNMRLEISVQLVIGDNVREQDNFFSSANLWSSFFFFCNFHFAGWIWLCFVLLWWSQDKLSILLHEYFDKHK